MVLEVLKEVLENLYQMSCSVAVKPHLLLHLFLFAALMRGIGRFDKRGSISDALNKVLEHMLW